MKGIIALDIDGTLTADFPAIPPRVIAYLNRLADEGWRFIFITGRTFKSSYESLKGLTFPYHFAVQNGAIIIEMPSQRIVSKKYLDRSIFSEMEAICDGEPTDFVIYPGFEHRDECFFRPKHFSSPLLSYLTERIHSYKETWHAVDSYDEMSIDAFASVKCFGIYPSALALAKKIEERLGLHVPLIRDPFNENYYVVQATHPEINKGQALKDFIVLTHAQGMIIAAGDDLNDISMLAVANVRVVMETAPKEMLQHAHIIAPSAKEEGILVGLKEALKLTL